MSPHKALAKTRLNSQSKVKSGAMLKPNAGVIPSAPSDQTTTLLLKPPRPPAMSI